MNNLQRIPDLSELESYSVNRKGQYEGIRQSLYDYQSYGTSGVGATQYSFFQIPVGQSSKTKADTNMTNAGMLPAPQKFLVQSIEVWFVPPSGTAKIPPEVSQSFAAATDPNSWSDDIASFYYGNAFLEFTIGSKPYLTEAPLARFPPKTGIQGNFAVSGTFTATAGLYWDTSRAVGRPYFLEGGLLIPATQNFTVTINFPTAVTLPSAATGGIVGVILDGFLYRLSQ